MGIKLHEVSFAYYVPKSKKKPIHFTLKDINIDINSRDEFIGLVGHTGSGKSTLVQLLNALYLPTKGEIDIFGNVITYKSKIKLKPIRKTVGLVFQFPEYQIFEDTVLKDIMFGPKNFGIENPEQVAREVAEILGISDLLDRSPFNLSGGQMRKVAIAGILASKPEILILDEPTAGLDPLTKIEFLEFLKELNEKHHKSIIIITHDMDIVSKYLKRVLVLKQGNLMFDGPKNKLFENEKLLQTCHLDYPKMIRIMKALKVIKERRSVRRYLSKPVPKDIIEDIVDCGRLAATARNIQPWHFIVVTDKERRKHIADLTDYGKFIEQAPVCIAVFCEDTKYYLEDGSAATQNILLAAKAHGLGSCWVAGEKKDYAEDIRKYLKVPRGYKLISLIAVGYAEQEGNPVKKSLSEVFHWEEYQE